MNQHLDNNSAYQVGVHDARGHRNTMEDAYSFIVDFAGVRGQGYFAIFDGHAGKYAAEWCGAHFHEVSPQSPLRTIAASCPHRPRLCWVAVVYEAWSEAARPGLGCRGEDGHGL